MKCKSEIKALKKLDKMRVMHKSLKYQAIYCPCHILEGDPIIILEGNVVGTMDDSERQVLSQDLTGDPSQVNKLSSRAATAGFQPT